MKIEDVEKLLFIQQNLKFSILLLGKNFQNLSLSLSLYRIYRVFGQFFYRIAIAYRFLFLDFAQPWSAGFGWVILEKLRDRMGMG
jgi:hypothetical protein